MIAETRKLFFFFSLSRAQYQQCFAVCCAAVQGYARLNQAEAALDVMRDFWQQGGEPDDSMFEVLVTLCVRTGEFRKALQVVHAMDKLGRPADKMRIKKVLEEFYRYCNQAQHHCCHVLQSCSTFQLLM